MRKLIPYIKPVLCLILCLSICIAFVCLIPKTEKQGNAEEIKTHLTIWQIDNFEGGKGSRADFLQSAGNEFSEISDSYVTVISLSSEAVRLNLANNNYPDLISYGAGIEGIEDYVDGYKCWCRGGYCLLTTEGDFSDITSENTVINEGKGNFVQIAALILGLQTAAHEKATGAYVKMLNGEYKYLLGTQRDIFRLKTRQASFKVKPVMEFNDLYQNISVINKSNNKKQASEFAEYILTKSSEVDKIGMLSETVKYDNEMKEMAGIQFECELKSYITSDKKAQLEKAVSAGDINILKNLIN